MSYDPDEYTFGYDIDKDEFLLWQRDRNTPVARISFPDVMGLMETVGHVAEVRERRAGATRKVTS